LSELCTIVGILDDGWAGLGTVARERLGGADCVIGVRRTLDLVAGDIAPSAIHLPMDGQVGAVAGWVRDARDRGEAVAVLATGDPFCYGVASYLARELGPEALEVLPAPSTIQVAFARLKRPWAGVRVVSVHGRDTGEWDWGSGPDHGLYALVRAAAVEERIACLTAPGNGPDRIARALLAAGFGATFRLSVAARLLLPDERIYADLPLAEAADRTFPDPNIAILERIAPFPPEPLIGLEDAEYITRRPGGPGTGGLITKLEVRAVSLAMMRLTPRSIVWDIGAGSGSVGLEAARMASLGHVYAIEKNSDSAAHARANARRLAATNYTMVEGKAPLDMSDWPDPDAVFIGGSGGELIPLIRLGLVRMRPGGRLVMNFITLEHLASAQAELNAMGVHWEAIHLSAARSEPILGMHRFTGQNPVWIVSADGPWAGVHQ